jgi:aminoglycoside phosphotransferase (APT) family kinase protein
VGSVELTPAQQRAVEVAAAYVGAEPVSVRAEWTWGPTVVVALTFADGLRAYVKAGAEQDVHREAAVIARARAAGVPVPEVLGTGTDLGLPGGRWLLTRAVPGRKLSDQGLESPTTSRTLDELADIYARLHAVSLPGFGPLAADGSCGTLASWSQWQRDTMEKALAQLGPSAPADRFRSLAATFAADLDRAPGVLLHADLGDGETYVDPSTGAVTAIVDWGAALVGDPLYDLVRFVGGGPAEDPRPKLLHPRLQARYLGPNDTAEARRMMAFYRFHICVVEAAWGEEYGWRPGHVAWAEQLFDQLCG